MKKCYIPSCRRDLPSILTGEYVMKKFFAAVVSVAALSGSLFADGVEFKLEKPADWKNTGSLKWVGKDKDTMEVSGIAMLSSTKLFDVDVNKKYKLEADVKMISGGPAITYFGFEAYDKDGVAIPAAAVNARLKSETPVVANAKIGSKTLLLKDNPNWNPVGIYAVALNAKENLSDLPNRDLLVVTGIKKVGSHIEVTLKEPLAKAVAAGTIVRAHLGGGYMYSGGWKNITAGQKVEFKGVAKGLATYGMGSVSWAPGTAKARVIMLVNWNNPKSVVQIDDVELEIEK